MRWALVDIVFNETSSSGVIQLIDARYKNDFTRIWKEPLIEKMKIMELVVQNICVEKIGS
jgi:hypothetical protein